MTIKPGTRCECDRVPILCGCGWGRLEAPECEVPETCPLCGFNFWDTFGTPDACPQESIKAPMPGACNLGRVRE